MYDNVARLLGFVSVRETPTHIIIDGISGLRFSKDVSTYWKTSKITKYMFTSIRSSQVKFPKFYAIEVLYMIEQLLQSRRMYTPRRALIKAAQELRAKTWLNKIGSTTFKSKLDLSRLRDLNVTLFVHQNNFLREYDRITQEYSLMGMLMDVAAGGGKTITNYALGHVLSVDTQIMIMPKNAIIDVWEKTIKSLFKVTPDYWQSLSGLEPVVGKPYYLVHYDYLEKFLNFVKANKRAFGKVFVAIDESHNFNEESARTANLIELCATLGAENVVHASGTPFKAMGSEATTLLATICQDFTDEARVGFRKIFGKEAKKANEILANRIGILSFKVPKAEIETPGVDFTPVNVKISNGNEYTLESIRAKMSAFIDERMKFYQKGMPEYQKLYDQCMELHQKTLKSPKETDMFRMYRDYIRQIRKGYDPVTMKDMVMYCNRYELKNIAPSLPELLRKPFINVRAIIKYVELKVLGEALSRVLGNLRMQCHMDMIPEMKLDEIIDNATTKTVIFTSYVEVVKELQDVLGKAGYNPSAVFGETNKDLPAILKKFESDPDANPLIATFKSLSTAVPLVFANTLVFTNSPFREYERTQTIARVDRIGQKHRCHVFDVFLDTGETPNISTRSKDILSWSKQQVEQILGVQTPDDIEASLESLMENPNANVVEAEDFIEQLKAELPLDVIEGDTVSVEGFFGSNAPKVNLYNPREVLRVLKETYLNSSWRTKQTWKEGKISVVDGHMVNQKNISELKRALDKQASQITGRAANIAGDATSFANGGWKDQAKIDKWLKGIRTEYLYGARSKSTVEVICTYDEVPGMENYVMGGNPTVPCLSSDAEISSAAQKLESIVGHRVAITYDLIEKVFTDKKFHPFRDDEEASSKLVDAIHDSDLENKRDVLRVYNAIKNTIEKVETDFLNSPEKRVFDTYYNAAYRAMWSQLVKSTK